MRISILFFVVLFTVSCSKGDDEILSNIEIIEENEITIYTYEKNEIFINNEVTIVEWEFSRKEGDVVYELKRDFSVNGDRFIKFSIKYEGTYTLTIKGKHVSGQLLKDEIKIITKRSPCGIPEDLNTILIYEDNFVDQGSWDLNNITGTIAFDNKLYMESIGSTVEATKNLSEFNIQENDKLLFDIDVSFLKSYHRHYDCDNGFGLYSSGGGIRLYLFNKIIWINGTDEPCFNNGLGATYFEEDKLTIYIDLENEFFKACYKGEDVSGLFRKNFDYFSSVSPKLVFVAYGDFDGVTGTKYPGSLEINSLKMYKVEN
ncbi:hypothetical protein [Aquimarina sp. AU474]|uniref:hypothetical protein n=1 Tax=Aquimarina sp. AU474 TaxID=2108529 RepID=UPI000D68AFE9|nr:hypothetical protein [Aquimarina sp. AU474]